MNVAILSEITLVKAFVIGGLIAFVVYVIQLGVRNVELGIKNELSSIRNELSSIKRAIESK